jgi:hypothetical protein
MDLASVRLNPAWTTMNATLSADDSAITLLGRQHLKTEPEPLS